jgi:hypothetical protein
MDPDAALVEAREAARIVLDGNDAEALEAAVTLAERFQALDDWLSGGSFPPADWARGR